MSCLAPRTSPLMPHTPCLKAHAPPFKLHRNTPRTSSSTFQSSCIESHLSPHAAHPRFLLPMAHALCCTTHASHAMSRNSHLILRTSNHTPRPIQYDAIRYISIQHNKIQYGTTWRETQPIPHLIPGLCCRHSHNHMYGMCIGDWVWLHISEGCDWCHVCFVIPPNQGAWLDTKGTEPKEETLLRERERNGIPVSPAQCRVTCIH